MIKLVLETRTAKTMVCIFNKSIPHSVIHSEGHLITQITSLQSGAFQHFSRLSSTALPLTKDVNYKEVRKSQS